MSFDWESYLEVAQTLLDEAEQEKADSTKALQCEAQFRCCISRAYYAAFCLARNYLRDVDMNANILDCNDASIHRIVVQAFRQERDGNYQKIAAILTRLRIERNCADYDDAWVSLVALSPKAKTVLKDASQVVVLLRKLSDRTQP